MRARALLAALAAALLAAPAASAQDVAQCPWMDAGMPPAERTAQLLGAMTLEEKIALSYGSNSSYGFAAQTPANDRLCIPQFVYSDGPAGIAGGFGGTQTGVTAFPTGIAQGASWDPALQRRFGETVAREALDKGANVLLAPAMNINRVPMNGRNFEYFGEDPFLSARIAVAQTKGIQSLPVVATAKHYAANNQETDRMSVSAEVDERTMREIYLPAFEASVREGRAGSVMCAYNKVGGAYACENPTLLNEILKDDWGFDGWVMSDWFATHSTEAAVLAGLDQEQNGFAPNYFGDKLLAAVREGTVPEARIDDLARRVLLPAFRIGLFDQRPAAQPGAFGADVSTEANHRVAAEMAEGAAVLLKNADRALPLDRLSAGSRIAVIGRSAGPGAAQASAVGSGSAHVNGVVVDPLSAIQRRAAAEQAVVTYTEGTSAIADAVTAATAADVAVVFVRDAAGEGQDRPGLEINDGVCVLVACTAGTADQNALVEAVADANPNTIVVAVTSGPVAMPWLDKVKSVLEVWWPGSEYGNAVASLLFGDANPSGKLPQTFPKAAGDMPVRTPEQYPGTNGKAVYSEGLKVGYRWYDAEGIEPLFEFGFGLSYTTFALSDLAVTRAKGAPVLRAAFTVANTGERAGAEVAQVYLGFPSAAGEPPKQLKGFRKVALGPGARKRAAVTLDERAFSTWDAAQDDWVVAKGCYELMLGSSSRAIAAQRTLAVNGARCGPGALAVRIASAVDLPRKRCVRPRRFAIALHDPRGRERLRSVVVEVRGKVRRTLHGRALRTALRRGRVVVDLRRAQGRVRVAVSARTTKQRWIRRARSYRLC